MTREQRDVFISAFCYTVAIGLVVAYIATVLAIIVDGAP